MHCVFLDSPNAQPSFESDGALRIVYCVFSIHTWRVPAYFEGGCVLRIAYCVLRIAYCVRSPEAHMSSEPRLGATVSRGSPGGGGRG